jgi:hypothetical protein
MVAEGVGETVREVRWCLFPFPIGTKGRMKLSDSNNNLTSSSKILCFLAYVDLGNSLTFYEPQFILLKWGFIALFHYHCERQC